MTIPGITSNSSSATNALTGSSSTLPKQQLNQDDFLKLLTTQLAYQDPMNPMSDTQYISQMSSFTSLEQMRSLTSDFEKYSNAQGVSAAQGFLGKTVTATDAGGTSVTGVVSEVRTESGLPLLMVNGTSYDPSSVTSVRMPGTASAAAQ